MSALKTVRIRVEYSRGNCTCMVYQFCHFFFRCCWLLCNWDLRLLFANTESSTSYKLSCSTAFGVLNKSHNKE